VKEGLANWWSQRRSRRGLRLVALSAALGLVAIPTIWTLFPWLAGIWILWRALILVGWGGAALLIVRSTDQQARQVDELMGEARQHRLVARRKAGELAIDLLLRGRVGGLQPYCFDVYLPIAGQPNRVRVAYSSEEPMAAVEWADSQGATGYAFSTGQRAIARGPVARDETFHLNDEQQQAAANLEIVVAMPIKNEGARTIGVLTAYGPTDDGYLVTEEGFEEHASLAAVLARLIIDVCGLDTDDVTPPR
jgi:hypothetical protein